MANTIKLKRGSGSDPGASDLVVGEIAIRTDTGKLFTKKDNGSVAEISGSGGGSGNNFKINTLSSSSGTGGGSATFNGTAYRFTLSDPPGTSCAQCLVSVNGVIQKPTTGTSQPSEGFAIDGNDILFSAAPASGADYFIVTYDALSVTEVSDNSVEEGDLKISNAGSNGQFLQKQSGNTGGLTWATVDLSGKLNLTGGTLTGQLIAGGSGGEKIVLTGSDHPFIRFKDSGGTEKGYFQYSGGKFILANQQTGEDLKVGSGSNGLTYGVDSTDNIVWHAGNDGASSGLDSDKLDGQEGSYYLNASNLSSGTVAAARLDTATTQTAGNNSTKIATTAFVSTAVTNLIGGAPGALDTLNELAAAINDDSSYAASVTTSLGTKLNLSGGTLTGDVTFQGATSGRDILWDKSGNILHCKDNAGIQFGDSTDLKIYHNGSNSYIEDTGTGSLITKSNHYIVQAGAYSFMNTDNTETIIYGAEDGAVELYHNGNKKLETYGNGVKMAERLWVAGGGHVYLDDASHLHIGSGDDLQLFHNGSHSYIKDTGTGDLFICSDDLHIGNAANTEDMAVFKENGAVELYFDNVKKFETNTNGAKVHGNVYLDDNGEIRLGTDGDFQFYHHSATGTGRIYNSNAAGIQVISDLITFKNNATNETLLTASNGGAVELYFNNSKKFATYNGGAEVFGDCSLGDNRVLNIGTGSDLQIYHDGTHSKLVNSTGDLHLASNNAVKILGGSDLSEVQAVFNDNGSCELYYDNTKVFETVADGAKFTSNGNLEIGGATSPAIFRNQSGAGSGIHFSTNNCLPTDHTGQVVNNSIDLGSTSYRWRNLYINDLQLSNEGSQNSVDGTWGDWTLQEGEEDIFMINNRSGKKYKMALQEVS